MRSMTGFGAAEGAVDGTRWRWEARSVNGRGLEVRLRAPNKWDGAERAWKDAARAHLSRGSVTLGLTLDEEAQTSSLCLNEAVLERVLAMAAQIETQALEAGVSVAAPRIDGLMTLRGVLESDADARPEEADSALREAVDAGLQSALEHLAQARAQEGAALRANLESRVSTIEELVLQARARLGPRQDAMNTRLRERIKAALEAIGDAQTTLDETRIAQEIALLTVKTDVHEELDRLDAHIKAARALLSAQEPVGRKFDFLAQEFNREANTLASKSLDAPLTEIAMAMKVAIDQLREQAANVE